MSTWVMVADKGGFNKVRFVEGRGVQTVARRGSVHLPKKDVVGAKRGKVAGWSRASRRRMRKALLFCAPPAGWIVGGVTFTVPPPALGVQACRKLWARFCLEVAKAGAGMIWRVEVQKRGELHWHGIACCSPEMGLDWFEKAWFRELDRLGNVDLPVWVRQRKPGCLEVRSREPKGGQGWRAATWSGTTRASVPGAVEHAVCIEGSSINGEWLRYLQDHASKLKQGQVGENIGRHWGIVGRRHWGSVLPDDECFTDRQFNYILRCMQRLVTPHVKREGVQFGSKLGFRTKRGCRGSAEWFSRPATIRRICQEAVKEYPDEFPADFDPGGDVEDMAAQP